MTALLSIAAALLAGSACAEPIEPGVSSVEIASDGFAITIARDEFADRIPTENIEGAERLLEALLIDTTWISVDGQACRTGNGRLTVGQDDTVTIAAPILCNDGDSWRYHATWLRGRDASHRHVVQAFGEPVGVLTPEATTLDLVAVPAASTLSGVPNLVWLAFGVGLTLFAFLSASVLFWVSRLSGDR